jgi:hypothetical protein
LRAKTSKDRGSTWTARGVLAISSIEADSFAREFVYMRRGDMIEAIAT